MDLTDITELKKKKKSTRGLSLFLIEVCNCQRQLPVTTSDSHACIVQMRQDEACMKIIFGDATSP